MTRRVVTSRSTSVVIALALTAAACSEPAPSDATSPGAGAATSAPEVSVIEPPTPTGGTAPDIAPDTALDSVPDAAPDDGSVVAAHAGEPWFMGVIPERAVAADPDGEPIVIGMINQENTPLGSFPEIRGAVEAAVRWVNAELGGVGGRPIELVTCITSFSVEQSQACAQEMVQAGAVALVGGIDVTSNGSIPVLQQNGIPQIGGIPANLVEQQSATNFYFSGGGTGAIVGFLAHAAESGASSAMIAYGEFESFEVSATDYGKPVGELLGLDVQLVSFPVVATDMLPVVTAAVDADVDALIVLAADSACVPVMTGAEQLGLRAQLYLTGACAAESIVEAAGAAATQVVFNNEGPQDDGNVEALLYTDVVERYATAPAGGAGTVGFRGFMNLYSLLVELGPDGVSSEAIVELVRSAVDRLSFWGHPYTCDGERVPGLPSLCAPEQTLFRLPRPADLEPVTDGWIEVDDLLREAVGG
jgi:branched-chain amino acid transport system substrate-binding protein